MRIPEDAQKEVLAAAKAVEGEKVLDGKDKTNIPTYSFICSCGQKKEVVRPMSESNLPVLCTRCSFVMMRDFKADFGKQRCADTWPMASYAAGVHPKQIPEMREFDRQHEVLTDYTSDGDPVFTGPKHRRKYCEAHGLFDRNAGLSDPVPARCK